MCNGRLVKYEKRGNVGIVTFDNSKQHNAISKSLLDELEMIQREIEKDYDLRAIVLLSNGDNFSTGFDMTFLNSIDSDYVKKGLPRTQKIYSFWQEIHLPVIVGIQGACFGSAIEIISACDIRISAENARFGIFQVRFGVAPDVGGTARLTKLIGIGNAKRLILGCEEIKAVEAKNIGLVEIVVPTERLRDFSIAYAKKIGEHSPNGMRFAKKGINLAQDNSLAAGLLFEEVQSTYCCGTNDMKEAINAFVEKKKPTFTGN